MRPRWLTLLALLAVAPGTAAAAPGAPGWIDRGFGRGGTATLHDPYLSLAPNFLLAQPDGGLLLGADAHVPDSSAGPGSIVVRFTAAGKLDRGFGDHGRVETGLSTVRGALLAGGGFVLTGGTGDELAPQRTIRRYSKRGRPTPSFGGAGSISIPVDSPYDFPAPVAAGSDGRILVAGGDEIHAFATTGQPVPGFRAGHLAGALGPWSVTVSAIAVQPDGRILLAGERRRDSNGPSQLLLARLTQDGQVDPTFGGPGRGRILDDSSDWRAGAALALAPGGAIVATGSSADFTSFTGIRLPLWRLSADAADVALRFLPKTTSVDGGAGIAVDPSGGILVLGEGPLGGGEWKTFLLRARRDGSLDRGFGRRGRMAWDKRRSPAGPVVLPDGRIVVAMMQQLGTADIDLGTTDVSIVRLVRLWGGYDRAAPVIAVRLSCDEGRTVARLRVRDRSRISRLSVWIAGRRISPASHSRVRLVLRRTGTLRVLAIDQAGNDATRRVRVRHCVSD